jgi:chromatin remodeling complex protein RSC6
MATASGSRKKSSDKKASQANGFMKPLKPSKELAEIVRDEPLPRSEAVSKMWAYIKKHKLQNEKNKREIIADDKLEAVFDHKSKVNMFEMNKHLARHLK